MNMRVKYIFILQMFKPIYETSRSSSSFAWVYPQKETEFNTLTSAGTVFFPLSVQSERRRRVEWRRCCGQSEKWDDEAMPKMVQPATDERVGVKHIPFIPKPPLSFIIHILSPPKSLTPVSCFWERLCLLADPNSAGKVLTTTECYMKDRMHF